jgi:hypothetical protein
MGGIMKGRLIVIASMMSAIQALQDTPPQLATVKEVEILKTGIEYPLASGPTTFTPDDILSFVQSQDDPSIPAPRIYIGHPDDPRIHGKRHPGERPSGEPALGSVTNIHLTEEGQTAVGDYTGVPLWLARIMKSAYPSRSVEGNFNVGPTPTGHTWQLVVHGVALLGVTWPGVNTLDDIAALYTPNGPEGVEVIEASSDEPVTVIAAAERSVRGQLNVEDIRRQYYDSLEGEQAWWWIRAIYLDPDELIVDDEDGGIFRVPFSVDGEDAKFEEATKVKIKYVNASGSTEPKADFDIPEHQYRVVAFASAADSRVPVPKPHEVNVTIKNTSTTINAKINRK